MQWTLPRSPPLHLLLGSALLLTLAAAATVDVSIDGALDNPTLKKAVEVAARQITSKSNATVGLDASNAAIHIVVRVDTAIGPESFAIATLPSGDDGGVSVTGGDARGVYYGLGNLLHPVVVAGILVASRAERLPSDVPRDAPPELLPGCSNR